MSADERLAMENGIYVNIYVHTQIYVLHMDNDSYYDTHTYIIAQYGMVIEYTVIILFLNVLTL